MAAPTASAPESTAFIVSHPSLGTLNGLIPASTPSVAQFRNIPFGRIPARFRQSVLATTLSDDERDCTEYGTICPQFDQGSQMYGGKMRLEKPKKYDEFSCLNLSISAPKKVIEQKAEGKGFPVMVYVHGGGFVTGRGNASTLHGQPSQIIKV
jgi:carboxylesterase type B